MTTSANNIMRHLPEVYSTRSDQGNVHLLASVDVALEELRVAVSDYKTDQAVTTSDEDGLTWLARLYGITRPPGMDDPSLRALLLALIGARRGTLAAIKAVVDACTGVPCDVNDKQTDPTIPSWEIRISPSGSDFWSSQGRGLYAGIDTETFYSAPLRSALAGPILDALGYYGAFINDHAWYPVDIYTLAILEKVRPAGTYYVFTGV